MQNVMLTSKKVKLHGMKSRRWTIQDKIKQYKGLVNLYGRDKKILDYDTAVNRRKLKKEIRNLNKEVCDQRNELNNAIAGDRQRLRNTLAEHRQMQLAYSRLHPVKVLDVLHQDNFNKRKLLDRVTYKMKQKTEKLIELKLLYADLEDRIKYEANEKIPEEEMAQIITAKEQDAILKIDAAMAVRNSYKNILDILKKDAIYMDAVLAALQIDGYNQGKCLIKVTEMGQLATEYLDDRKDEYRILERVIKKSMAARDKSLRDVKEHIESLHNNVKYLIRKDSIIDFDPDRRSSRSSVSDLELLRRNVEDIEDTINNLKEITYVSKVHDIFPRMVEQQRQKGRLRDLVERIVEDRNTLLNKSKHAEEMFNSLNHTMVETTFFYKEEKKRLNDEINDVVEARKETDKTIVHRGEIFLKIRTSLQTLSEFLRNVALEDKDKAKKQKGKTKQVAIDNEIFRPEPVEVDAMKLITNITDKLNVLVSNATINLDEEDMEEAAEEYQKFVSDMTVFAYLDQAPAKDALIEVTMEDPLVPNRFQIKARSEKICEDNKPKEGEANIMDLLKKK